MSKIVLSRQIFEMLVKHLVDIEEERDRIMEVYYPNLTEERDGFQHLMKDYMGKVENYITNAKVEEGINTNCPFVTIGSIVEVEDLTYNEIERFQIISPFMSKINVKWDCASYLSPMGKALLLKKVKEKVDIETPAGKSTYRVKSIELPQQNTLIC